MQVTREKRMEREQEEECRAVEEVVELRFCAGVGVEASFPVVVREWGVAVK